MSVPAGHLISLVLTGYSYCCFPWQLCWCAVIGLINIHIYRNLLNICIYIYIFYEGSCEVCYCYKGNFGIRGKCNGIFWGPYTFKCLQLVKYCFKCDFELILYHDVCMNKRNVTCAAVCSCWRFTLWSFSLNPVFATPLHEQHLKYHKYIMVYQVTYFVCVFVWFHIHYPCFSVLFTCTIYFSIYKINDLKF